MADNVYARREKTSDHQKFLVAAAFDSAQGESVVLEARFEAELAVAEVVEKSGEAAVQRAGAGAGTQHGDLVQRLDADLLFLAAFHRMQIDLIIRRLPVDDHEILDGAFQDA